MNGSSIGVRMVPGFTALKLGRIIKRIVKLLTRKGYLIEEQGMAYLAEADSDRRSRPCNRRRAPTA